MRRSFAVIIYSLGLFGNRSKTSTEGSKISYTPQLKIKDTEKSVMFEESGLSRNADFPSDKRYIYLYRKLSKEDKVTLYATRPDLDPSECLYDKTDSPPHSPLPIKNSSSLNSVSDIQSIQNNIDSMYVIPHKETKNVIRTANSYTSNQMPHENADNAQLTNPLLTGTIEAPQNNSTSEIIFKRDNIHPQSSRISSDNTEVFQKVIETDCSARDSDLVLTEYYSSSDDDSDDEDEQLQALVNS